MLHIPISIDQNDFTLDVELEGVVCTLYLSWNSVMQMWTLGFLDEFGDPLLLNIPLRANTFLLQQYSAADIPPGEMFVQFLQAGDPGRMSFVDGSAKMMHLSKDEDDALR